MNPYEALPAAFINNIKKDLKDGEPKVGNEEEELLKRLSTSDEWKLLKTFIESQQALLANQLRKNAESGNLAEVGARFMVTDLANSVITRIISYVETPAHIHEQREIERANNSRNNSK